MKPIILRISNTILLAVFVGCIGVSIAMAQMSGSNGSGAGSPSGSTGGAGMNRPASPGANTPDATNGMPNQQNPMAASLQTSFLHNVAENSLAENELSKLAMDKSSNDNVKQVAQQVMQEHQKLDTALSGAAQANSNFSMPKKVPGRVNKDEKKMQTLSGTQFDQAYLTELNRYEKKDQSMAKDMAQQTNSSGMKQFSNAVHNMAETHTQQIAQIARSENVDLKK